MNSVIDQYRELVPCNYVEAKTVIPPMTDPLSVYWKQPSLDGMKIFRGEIWMTQSQFDKLADYTFSKPTGCYDGKCWKKQWQRPGGPLVWLMCWFAPIPENTTHCTTKTLQIFIL